MGSEMCIRDSEMTVELNVEDQGVNSDTLILGLGETFGGDGQRHFTLLEVEVCGGEDGHDGLGGIGSGIEAAVGGWNIVVEVALGNTVDVDDWGWNVGSYVNHNQTVGQDVGLGQVVPQEKNYFNRSSLPNRQLYGTLHGMQFHLSDVSGGFVDGDALTVGLSQASMLPESLDGKGISCGNKRRDQRLEEGELLRPGNLGEVGEREGGEAVGRVDLSQPVG